MRADLTKSTLSRTALIDSLVRYVAEARRLRTTKQKRPRVHEVVLGPVDGVPVAAPCILSGCHYAQLEERDRVLRRVRQALGDEEYRAGLKPAQHCHIIDHACEILREVGITYERLTPRKRAMGKGVEPSSPLSRAVREKAIEVLAVTPPSQRAAARTALDQLERLFVNQS